MLWVLTPELTQQVQRAAAALGALADATRVCATRFDAFGKRHIKACKLSPDGFVQMAFQLAYYRLHVAAPDAEVAAAAAAAVAAGAAGAAMPFSVYESASTKTFLFGRTEAVRCVTAASARFCAAMHALRSRSPGGEGGVRKGRAAAAAVLAEAVAVHRQRAADAGNARGVDRHLFALYRMAAAGAVGGQPRPEPLPAMFSDEAWARLNTSVLSTSCVNGPHIENIVFGAVCPDGYGIGYVVKDDFIDLTVSNFVRDPSTGGSGFGGVERAAAKPGEGTRTRTDARAFAAHVIGALRDMAALCAVDGGAGAGAEGTARL
eukprot:g7547.t1